jgi:hypothetical protein
MTNFLTKLVDFGYISDEMTEFNLPHSELDSIMSDMREGKLVWPDHNFDKTDLTFETITNYNDSTPSAIILMSLILHTQLVRRNLLNNLTGL